MKLVLARPQHYHVYVYRYQALNPQTNDFMFSTIFHLIEFDVDEAIKKAEKMGAKNQSHTHVREVSQCSEPTHLAGITA